MVLLQTAPLGVDGSPDMSQMFKKKIKWEMGADSNQVDFNTGRLSKCDKK